MIEGSDRTAIPDEIISSKIYFIRDKKIMLDKDLAELYGVITGNLNKAVKRNISRFPEDFMFQLTKDEFENLIFQIGISSWGGRRTPPYAFTDLGEQHDTKHETIHWYFDTEMLTCPVEAHSAARKISV